MVRAGALATANREPRQVRKEATVAGKLGAGMLLARILFCKMEIIAVTTQV